MRHFSLVWASMLVIGALCGRAGAADAAPEDHARVLELKAHADALVEQGLLAEAVEIYGRALALAPDAPIHYNRGRTLASLGQYPAAVKDLEAFQRIASPELRERVSGLPEFLARIRRRVSSVQVSCDVPGAQVRFRGVDVGVCPLTEDIVVTSGPATLEIRKDGYFPYKRDFDFPGGGRSVIETHLASKNTSGVVTITSPVLGSSVTVDDKPWGLVPVELPLAMGPHRITLTHEGYQTATTTFRVEAGTSGEVSVLLEKEPSIVKKWWFWTAIGVGLAAGAATVYALTTERALDKGTLPPGNFTVGFRGL